MNNILIIKYGALGDFFQALQVFETIRAAFPKAKITLLTRPTYKEIAKATGYFDTIIEDDRPSARTLKNWVLFYQLYKKLQKFDFIFDFQNAQRTKLYFHILRLNAFLSPPQKCPLWSGQIKQASHPHLNPHIKCLHTLTRQEEQLKAANLTPKTRQFPHWVQHLPPLKFPMPPSPYVILSPGAAHHRPQKLWPIEHFKALLPSFAEENLTCVIIGDKKQRFLGDALTQYASTTPYTLKRTPLYNFMGETSLLELILLIKNAALILGNDTGPLHIAAALNRPTLTLFSSASDPRRTAPIPLSPHKARLLSADDLAQIPSQTVISLLKEWAYPLIKN